VGTYGIWCADLRVNDIDEATGAAAELEDLGFGALWLPGRGADIYERVSALLDATERIVVATGVVTIWRHGAVEAAAAHAEITRRHPGRFLLGIGVSHAQIVDRTEPGRYAKPLQHLAAYLDELDAASPPVPKEERLLASLGPRSIALAGARTAGTHPYLVTPDHSRFARDLLGPGPLVAPEQAVALGDANRRRELGRGHLHGYLQMPNYTRNWLRLGFTPADLEGGGSDRLVDALVAGGEPEAAVARAQEHLSAGADHVCFQVLAGGGPPPRSEWRALAAALDLLH
jgi:probable F420-dependent oxidoreductase